MPWSWAPGPLGPFPGGGVFPDDEPFPFAVPFLLGLVPLALAGILVLLLFGILSGVVLLVVRSARTGT